MAADDLARYGAEGAAMPLEEVIAYALELPAGAACRAMSIDPAPEADGLDLDR